MGYRSQVVLAISKHLIPFMLLATSKNKAAEELVFKDTDTFNRDYCGDKSWLMVWGSIKWYDSYEEISTIMEFVEKAAADDIEFEVDGEPQSSAEHIRFVHVGEEPGDITILGDSFWDIYPHTQIAYQEHKMLSILIGTACIIYIWKAIPVK